jgi:hypothetical protein
MLEELGIPLRRTNEDKVINQYVRILLNLCKYNNVFILNGRIGEDKEVRLRGIPNSSNIYALLVSINKCSTFSSLPDSLSKLITSGSFEGQRYW